MGQLELKTSGQLEETFGSFPQSWCRPKEGAVGRQCYGQADSDTMSVSEGQREALQVWGGKGNCDSTSHQWGLTDTKQGVLLEAFETLYSPFTSQRT